MTDTLETTWAELDVNDMVLDATGKQWRVYSVTHGVDGSGTITQSVTGITDGERYVTVNKEPHETVLTVPSAVADITNGAVATETAAEAQARQSSDTFPDASTLSPLELRTHLYLVHGNRGAAQPIPHGEMVAWHGELHQRGPAATPHSHEYAG